MISEHKVFQYEANRTIAKMPQKRFANFRPTIHTHKKIVFGGASMRLDQYSSRRNVRPGFPTAEEIRKTTEVWKGDKREVAEAVASEANRPEKARHF
jgi:hypothetical protein